jgi:hypothetical protein
MLRMNVSNPSGIPHRAIRLRYVGYAAQTRMEFGVQPESWSAMRLK